MVMNTMYIEIKIQVVKKHEQTGQVYMYTHWQNVLKNRLSLIV